MLHSVGHTDVMLKWILLFSDFKDGNNFLVCNNLFQTYLYDVIRKNSDAQDTNTKYFVSEKYDIGIDPLGIASQVVKEETGQKSNVNVEEISQATVGFNYYIVRIPLSISTYNKLMQLSLSTEFTAEDADVYNILRYFLPHWKDARLLTYKLCQLFLTDTALKDRLEIYHRECQTKRTRVSLDENSDSNNKILLSLRNNMEKHVYYRLLDDKRNITVTASCKERITRIPLSVKLADFRPLFPINHLAMNYTFLSDNQAELMRLRHNFSKNSMAIDLDFSKFVSDVPYTQTQELFPDMNFMFTFCCLLRSNLFSNSAITKLILRFSHSNLIFSLTFILVDNVVIYAVRCIFSDKLLLPLVTNELNIFHSAINLNLKLGAHLKKLKMEDVQIGQGYGVLLNEGCQSIMLVNVRGTVVLPSSDIMHKIDLGPIWTEFELHRNDAGETVDLKITNARITSDLALNDDMARVHLKNIRTENGARLKLGRNCRDIQIEQFEGEFHAYNSESLQIIPFSNKITFLQLEKLENASEYKFSLLNEYLEDGIETQHFPQSISLVNVKIGSNAFVKVRNNCMNFVAKDLEGKVDFAGIYNMQIVDCALMPDIQSNNGLSLHNALILDRSNHKIYMCNLKLNHTIYFSFGAEDVTLQSVEVVDGCTVSVANTLNRFEIYDCKGVFHVPILNQVLSLNARDCFVRITRNGDGSFDVLLAEIEVSTPICLRDNIGSVYIRSVSGTSLQINTRCDHLYLMNSILEINYTYCTPLKKLALCCFASIAPPLLLIPSIEMILEDVTIHRSIAISDHVKNITLSNVCISEGCILNLNSTCRRISVDRCVGMLDISVITKYGDINCLLFNYAGVLNFRTFLCKSVLELELRHITIDHDLELAENITSVILFCVNVNKENALVVGTGCEQLIVEHCDGTIDITQSEKITILTLTDTPMIYNKEVHKAVTHLYLGHMALTQTVVLGSSIRTLYLSKLITERGKLCINVDCKALYIENYNDELLVPNILFPLHLSHKTIIELKPMGDTTSLSLANLRLCTNNALSDNVKALKLSGFASEDSAELMIGRCCEILDLDNCCANINISSSNRLHTIILRNMQYYHFLAYSRITRLNMFELHNIDIPSDLEFHENTRTLSMSSVTVRQGRTLIIDGEREEIRLEHCVGTFNMLSVRNLKKLVFYPAVNGYFSVYFPVLAILDDLTLSYNFDTTNVEYLLSHSVNITSLSLFSFSGLRSTKHKESFEHEIKSIIKSFGPQDDYKQQAMSYYRENCELSTDDLISIVNLRMNVFANIIFNFQTCNTLERLCLKGFSLNEMNLRKLRTCTSLKFLSVEIHFVPSNFFRSLPPNLETLRISDEHSFDFYDSSDEAAGEINQKYLMQHDNLRTLILSSVLVLLNDQCFKQLPTKLECLEIGYFDVPKESHELRDTKAVLKQLVIVGTPLDYNHSIARYPKYITRDHENLLNYLSLFIDFSSLVVLQLKIADNTIDIVPQSLLVRDE